MRLLYLVLGYLLAPVVIAMEAWKAIWHPEYRGRLGQRMGHVEPQPAAGCLWVHAVSVGEVQAAAALIHSLQRLYPAIPVVVTTVTPTGAQRARSLFGDNALDRFGAPSYPELVVAVTRRTLDEERDLVEGTAAALRRGIKDENLAPGFRISGLGQLVESGIQADRMVVFGD